MAMSAGSCNFLGGDATKKANAEYENVMSAKKGQLDTVRNYLTKMDEENGARGMSEQEAEDEWKDRQVLRAGELEAINKTMSILRNDGAWDLFKKSFASQAAPESVQTNFDRVIKAIDKMIALLESDIAKSKDEIEALQAEHKQVKEDIRITAQHTEKEAAEKEDEKSAEKAAGEKTNKEDAERNAAERVVAEEKANSSPGNCVIDSHETPLTWKDLGAAAVEDLRGLLPWKDLGAAAVAIVPTQLLAALKAEGFPGFCILAFSFPVPKKCQGKTIVENKISQKYKLTVLVVETTDGLYAGAAASTVELSESSRLWVGFQHGTKQNEVEGRIYDFLESELVPGSIELRVLPLYDFPASNIPSWVGSRLSKIDIRNKYGVSVIGISPGNETSFLDWTLCPPADHVLQNRDTLLVLMPDAGRCLAIQRSFECAIKKENEELRAETEEEARLAAIVEAKAKAEEERKTAEEERRKAGAEAEEEARVAAMEEAKAEEERKIAEEERRKVAWSIKTNELKRRGGRPVTSLPYYMSNMPALRLMVCLDPGGLTLKLKIVPPLSDESCTVEGEENCTGVKETRMLYKSLKFKFKLFVGTVEKGTFEHDFGHDCIYECFFEDCSQALANDAVDVGVEIISPP